jgi:hypothetical protein
MENLDKYLEQALSFSQYQSTLNQQRRLLKEKFSADTLFAYNGGLFKLDSVWIRSFDLESNWHLDINENPIYIDNTHEFIDKAKECYNQALKEYGEAFQDLRKKRNVKGLTDL